MSLLGLEVLAYGEELNLLRACLDCGQLTGRFCEPLLQDADCMAVTRIPRAGYKGTCRAGGPRSVAAATGDLVRATSAGDVWQETVGIRPVTCPRIRSVTWNESPRKLQDHGTPNANYGLNTNSLAARFYACTRAFSGLAVLL